MNLTRVTFENSDDYQAHVAVEDLFHGQGERILFRRAGGKLRVLTSSAPKGASDCILESREVTVPAADSFVPFRILFNPTKSVKGATSGRKHGLETVEEAEAWLRRKLEAGGCSVMQVLVDFEGVHYLEKTNGTPVPPITSYSATGVLCVLDADKLTELLLKGVGSAKFAGWGMLDIFK